MLTDTLALVILAFISGSATGDANGVELILQVVLGLAILVAFTFGVLPPIARWFFRTIGQPRTLRYVFMLAALLSAGVVAEVVGIESIVGAFFCGLALNRLVPNEGEFMERIEFFGSALLIPMFLVSIGTVIDPAVLVDPGTLGLAGVFVVACIGGKLDRRAAVQAAVPLHERRGRRRLRPVGRPGGGDAGGDVRRARDRPLHDVDGQRGDDRDRRQPDPRLGLRHPLRRPDAQAGGRHDPLRAGRARPRRRPRGRAARARRRRRDRRRRRRHRAPDVRRRRRWRARPAELTEQVQREITRLALDAELEVRHDRSVTDGLLHAAGSHHASLLVAPAMSQSWLPALLGAGQHAPRRRLAGARRPRARRSRERPTGPSSPSRAAGQAAEQRRRAGRAAAARLRRAGTELVVVAGDEPRDDLAAILGGPPTVTVENPAAGWSAPVRPTDVVVVPGGRNGALATARVTRQAVAVGATVVARRRPRVGHHQRPGRRGLGLVTRRASAAPCDKLTSGSALRRSFVFVDAGSLRPG